MATSVSSSSGGDKSESENSVDCLTLDFGPFEAVNRWQKMPDVSKFVGAPRSKHTIVTFNNGIYVFGGDNGLSMLNDLLRFDVKEKSWCRAFATGTPPAPRYHHSAVVHESSMYVFGGYTGDLHSNSNLRNKNDLWEYKFDTTQWVEVRIPPGSPQPVPRSAHGAAVYQKWLYIFAGYDGNARLSDMWRIALSNSTEPNSANQWEQVQCSGDSPPTCCNFPVAVARESMYVFSGQTGIVNTNSLYRFNFASSLWTRISIEHVLQDSPNPPIRRYGHSMVAYDRHLYVFGGAADNILPNELHCFDLDDQKWTIMDNSTSEAGSVPSGRLFQGATMVNDTLYLFGGTVDNNTRSGEMFRFQFAVFPSCTLHEDIAKLLSPTLRFTTDVEFLVGKNETSVRAHMAIVAARCDWLRERILAAKKIKLEVSDVDGDVQVKLPEVEPEPFSLCLEYMYSDKIDPTLQGVKHGAFSNEMVHLIMQVYTLSIVFHMKRLEKLCIRYLEASVNLDNVLVSLQTASILFLQPIKEYCLRYITKDSNYNHIVMSTEFESLDQPLMVEIIRRRQMKETAPASSDHRQPGQGDSKSSSLKDDLRRFLQATGAEFSDIKLVLESNTFPAHKAILAARSSYFEGLFRSFSPTGSNQMHSVKIGEILPSRQSFFSLMRFIYYGDVDMPVEDSLYLFTAHAFYIFSNNRLQVYCKHNLERNVTIENVIQIVEAADKSNVHDMKNYALDLIVRNFPRVAHQPQMKNLSRPLLLDILYALAK